MILGTLREKAVVEAVMTADKIKILVNRQRPILQVTGV